MMTDVSTLNGDAAGTFDNQVNRHYRRYAAWKRKATAEKVRSPFGEKSISRTARGSG
jgi:hypothetical protein